jgi:hypothetical protein
MAGAITVAEVITTDGAEAIIMDGAIIAIGETSLPSGNHSGRSRLSLVAFSFGPKVLCLAAWPRHTAKAAKADLRQQMFDGRSSPKTELAQLNRLKRPLSRGSSPAGYPAEPLVSYQINRQFSGWNLPPLVIRAFGAHCHQATSERQIAVAPLSLIA